jgi:hypothetical protein
MTRHAGSAEVELRCWDEKCEDVSFVRAVVEEQRRDRPPQYLQVFAMPLGGLTRSRVCYARAIGRCETIRAGRRS